MPSERLKLIKDYGKEKCSCCECLCKKIILKQCEENPNDILKSIYYFKELYVFPTENELKKHFKIGRKYKMFQMLFYHQMYFNKNNVIDTVEGGNIKYSVETSLKEFNEILKFIFENDY